MLHQYSDSRHRDDSFIYFISLQEAVKPFQKDYWVLTNRTLKDISPSDTDTAPQIKEGIIQEINLFVATPPHSFLMDPTRATLQLAWATDWGCQ